MTKIPNEVRVLANSLDCLEEIEQDVWRQLEVAVHQTSHGWHLPVLGTRGPDGCQLRSVVLRDVDPAARLLLCHTDRRSAKVNQIVSNPLVQWHFYDPVHRVQALLMGQARVHTDDELATAQWEASRPESRRCYLAPQAPGVPLTAGEVNLPDAFRREIPSESESVAGRGNFAVVVCVVSEIDWLSLHQHGNVRARFRYEAGGASAEWIAA